MNHGNDLNAEQQDVEEILYFLVPLHLLILITVTTTTTTRKRRTRRTRKKKMKIHG